MIRKAQPNEAYLLSDIYRRENELDDAILVDSEAPGEFAEIASGERVIWFAEQNDIVVGSIQLVLFSTKKSELANGSTIAMIHHIRVSKNTEGTGIGSMLFKTLENEARHRGVQTLTLEVEKTNKRATSIYNHWGFTYWKDGTDPNEIVLKKEL